jgi:hypothetical protein
MTSLILALLLAVPPAKAESPAASGQLSVQLSDDEVRQRVQALLSNIDTRNLAVRWQALGSRAADQLEPIAQSADEMPSRRIKAVAGLVLAAPDRAAPLATKLLLDETQPVAVRMAALRAVGRTVPPAAAAKSLGKVLRGAREPELRSLAAEAVTASGSSSGCAQVRAQVAREEHDFRPAYGRALAQCKE